MIPLRDEIFIRGNGEGVARAPRSSDFALATGGLRSARLCGGEGGVFAISLMIVSGEICVDGSCRGAAACSEALACSGATAGPGASLGIAGAKFAGADMGVTILRETDLEGVDLSGVDLSTTLMPKDYVAQK